MKTIILLVIALCILLIFTSIRNRSTTFNYVDLACDIRKSVAERLSKKHKMNVVSVNGGMMNSVYLIGIGLNISHPLTREEARFLVVDCAEELMKSVNENKQIRPYLREFPFTTKNINIAVFSSQPDGWDVFDPHICVASVSESNEIVYRTQAPENKFGYKNEYRESYAEALAIVRSGRSGQ